LIQNEKRLENIDGIICSRVWKSGRLFWKV